MVTRLSRPKKTKTAIQNVLFKLKACKVPGVTPLLDFQSETNLYSVLDKHLDFNMMSLQFFNNIFCRILGFQTRIERFYDKQRLSFTLSPSNLKLVHRLTLSIQLFVIDDVDQAWAN